MSAALPKHVSVVPDFANARTSPSPQQRVKDMKRAAQSFRERVLRGKPVPYYESFDLIRAPYPTKYGLRDAYNGFSPFLHILNRMFLVQFRTSEGLKTMIVSPSDVDGGNRDTPYFKRLGDMSSRVPVVRDYLPGILAPIYGTVDKYLEQLGIDPAEIDYITYDHLHTQDLRKWLGTTDKPGYFPRAKLLVTRQEWDSTKELTPLQADWYCPGGIQGVSEDRVILFDKDIMLGEGVFLICTPGHTEGNHSIVVHTDEGLMVTSENGIGCDSYAPLKSNIPGVRDYAVAVGTEVIPNGNTLERALDQYISMIQEKEIAGPSVRNSDFPNMLCSSELASYWLFPRIHPTFAFGAVHFGKYATVESRKA
eukprot:TRINITY_DN5656_c0_g1_i2.p1 TRINITY_DN5656_c0_g1~~TRINITY_DN5656_c0_g1_i2.p1  ORF type:complete len:366 (+),score=61.73 TRINITY_DN5656_c0_g1_i2:62-1159(+)